MLKDPKHHVQTFDMGHQLPKRSSTGMDLSFAKPVTSPNNQWSKDEQTAVDTQYALQKSVEMMESLPEGKDHPPINAYVNVGSQVATLGEAQKTNPMAHQIIVDPKSGAILVGTTPGDQNSKVNPQTIGQRVGYLYSKQHGKMNTEPFPTEVASGSSVELHQKQQQWIESHAVEDTWAAAFGRKVQNQIAAENPQLKFNIKGLWESKQQTLGNKGSLLMSEYPDGGIPSSVANTPLGHNYASGVGLKAFDVLAGKIGFARAFNLLDSVWNKLGADATFSDLRAQMELVATQGTTGKANPNIANAVSEAWDSVNVPKPVSAKFIVNGKEQTVTVMKGRNGYLLEDPLRHLKFFDLRGQSNPLSAVPLKVTSIEGFGSQAKDAPLAKLYYSAGQTIDYNKDVLGHPYGQFGNINVYVNPKPGTGFSYVSSSKGIVIADQSMARDMNRPEAALFPHEFDHFKGAALLDQLGMKPLPYEGEIGAINEGYADWSAVMVNQYSASHDDPSSKPNWNAGVLGRSNGGPLGRSIEWPAQDGVGRNFYSKNNFPYPYTAANDRGHVHANGGLVGLVGMIASGSGTHPMTGNGVDHPIDITLTSKIMDRAWMKWAQTPGGFGAWRQAVMDSAKELDPPSTPNSESPAMKAFRQAMDVVAIPKDPAIPPPAKRPGGSVQTKPTNFLGLAEEPSPAVFGTMPGTTPGDVSSSSNLPQSLSQQLSQNPSAINRVTTQLGGYLKGAQNIIQSMPGTEFSNKGLGRMAPFAALPNALKVLNSNAPAQDKAMTLGVLGAGTLSSPDLQKVLSQALTSGTGQKALDVLAKGMGATVPGLNAANMGLATVQMVNAFKSSDLKAKFKASVNFIASSMMTVGGPIGLIGFGIAMANDFGTDGLWDVMQKSQGKITSDAANIQQYNANYDRMESWKPHFNGYRLIDPGDPEYTLWDEHGHRVNDGGPAAS